MSTDELCSSCPLRSLCGTHAGELLEAVRIHTESKEDVRRLKLLTYGNTALNALKLQVPEKVCTALREILPLIPKATKRVHPYAECPQVDLIAEVYSEFPTS